MKIFTIAGKDYPVKYTFGNIKRTKFRNEEELKSGDIGIMLDHITKLFHCGLQGLGKYTEDQVEDIIQEYLENGGELNKLALDLNTEYMKALGLKMD